MNFGLNELERGKRKRIKVKEKIVRKYIKEIKKECKEALSKGETIVDLEYIFLDTPSGWSFSPSERKEMESCAAERVEQSTKWKLTRQPQHNYLGRIHGYSDALEYVENEED